jgi:tRNA(Ile)-lysidine synthase
VNAQKKKLLVRKGNEFHIPVEKLKLSQPLQTIAFEIIRDFGFEAAQVKELVRLFESESGRYILSSSHRILKNRNWLIISPIAGRETGLWCLMEDQDSLHLMLDFECAAGAFASQWNCNGSIVASLDGTEIKFRCCYAVEARRLFLSLGMKRKRNCRVSSSTKKCLSLKRRKTGPGMDKDSLGPRGAVTGDRFRFGPTQSFSLRIQTKPVMLL